MKHDQARHLHLQHVYDLALIVQDVVALDAQRCEDLSWNLADATISQRTWEDVHTTMLNELAHRGIGHDHGLKVVPALADALLRAVRDDPEPPPSVRAASSPSWLARHRQAREPRRRCWYTLEPRGREGQVDHAVLQAVLEVLRPWAADLQSDLPLDHRAQWPLAVAAAADHLVDVSKRQRGDSETYATTGWLPADDEETWQAFVTFAPYALDCDVLSEQASALVGIADQGASVALRLSAGQHSLLAPALQGHHLRRLP